MATLRRRLRDDDEPEAAAALAVLPIVDVPEGLPAALHSRVLAGGGATAGAIALGGATMKKTAVFLSTLLIALLAGAGVVALVLADREDDAARTSQQEGAGPIAGGEQPANTSQVRKEGEVVGETSATNTGAQTPDSVVDETEPTPPARRTLVATDPSGSPISLGFVVDWRMTEEEAWTTQHVTTGEDGRAHLEAPDGATLRVNLEGSEWLLGWRNVLLQPGQAEAPITAYRAMPLRVRVTYADGKAYEGNLTVKADRLWQASLDMRGPTSSKLSVPVGWPNLAERPMLYFHEIVEFAGLPSEVDITFETHASRPGYSVAKHTHKLTSDSSAELVEVVIPEGVAPNTPGKIVMLLDEGVKLDQPAVLLKVLPDGARRTSVWNSRDPLVSGKVWPARYVVVVLGELAWHSEEFELTAGETIELRPQLAPSCTLSAKVVNTKGEPVEGAALAFATRDLPRTNSSNMKFSRPFNGETLSDPRGALKLEGLPAGTFEFQVYAPGMQPWTGFATLVAGQDFDMGDLRLEAAPGRIEVQLPDWDYKARKVTWSLADPDGHTLKHAEVESNVLILEGLPVGRSYELKFHIRVGQGARAWWYPKKFELTQASPAIVLDGRDKKWPSDLD
jgi:hypothetical protein